MLLSFPPHSDVPWLISCAKSDNQLRRGTVAELNCKLALNLSGPKLQVSIVISVSFGRFRQRSNHSRSASVRRSGRRVQRHSTFPLVLSITVVTYTVTNVYQL